ncbi:MAG: hypothetical protein J6L69_04480 [Lachnospiraceae bacterium]|nr:hypothetical protein [Lachnospiraceae bacterium]
MRTILTSKRFWITMMLVALFRFLDLLPLIVSYSYVENGKWQNIYDVVGLHQCIGISMFALIIRMVPVLTYSSEFCDNYKSNYLTYALMRKGKTYYCVTTAIKCALSTFLCVLIGEVIVVLGLMTILDFNHNTTVNVQGVVMNDGQAIFDISSRIYLLSLRGAFYGVVTMLLSIFTLNKFVIYSIPIILHFFFMYFGVDYLKIDTMYNPAMVFDFFALGYEKPIQSLIYSTVYLIVTVFILERLMEKRIERCY